MKDVRLYNDSVIEVTIFIDDENESFMSIAMKYLKPPENLKGKDGKDVFITNSMGGETDWFIMPYTFGAAIGKKLFEQYNAGLDGFDQNGIEVLKSWLIDMEIIDNAMCY